MDLEFPNGNQLLTSIKFGKLEQTIEESKLRVEETRKTEEMSNLKPGNLYEPWLP